MLVVCFFSECDFLGQDYLKKGSIITEVQCNIDN